LSLARPPVAKSFGADKQWASQPQALAPRIRRLLAKPRPARPTAGNAQVEGSGTGAPVELSVITIFASPSEAKNVPVCWKIPSSRNVASKHVSSDRQPGLTSKISELPKTTRSKFRSG
jgi:hypothetical protein